MPNIIGLALGDNLTANTPATVSWTLKGVVEPVTVLQSRWTVTDGSDTYQYTSAVNGNATSWTPRFGESCQYTLEIRDARGKTTQIMSNISTIQGGAAPLPDSLDFGYPDGPQAGHPVSMTWSPLAAGQRVYACEWLIKKEAEGTSVAYAAPFTQTSSTFTPPAGSHAFTLRVRVVDSLGRWKFYDSNEIILQAYGQLDPLNGTITLTETEVEIGQVISGNIEATGAIPPLKVTSLVWHVMDELDYHGDGNIVTIERLVRDNTLGTTSYLAPKYGVKGWLEADVQDAAGRSVHLKSGEFTINQPASIEPMSLDLTLSPEYPINGESVLAVWKVEGGLPPYDVEARTYCDNKLVETNTYTMQGVYDHNLMYPSYGIHWEFHLTVTDASGQSVREESSFQLEGGVPEPMAGELVLDQHNVAIGSTITADLELFNATLAQVISAQVVVVDALMQEHSIKLSHEKLTTTFPFTVRMGQSGRFEVTVLDTLGRLETFTVPFVIIGDTAVAPMTIDMSMTQTTAPQKQTASWIIKGGTPEYAVTAHWVIKESNGQEHRLPANITDNSATLTPAFGAYGHLHLQVKDADGRQAETRSETFVIDNPQTAAPLTAIIDLIPQDSRAMSRSRAMPFGLRAPAPVPEQTQVTKGQTIRATWRFAGGQGPYKTTEVLYVTEGPDGRHVQTIALGSDSETSCSFAPENGLKGYLKITGQDDLGRRIEITSSQFKIIHPVTGITLNLKDPATLWVGEGNLTLTASVTPPEASNKTIHWSSQVEAFAKFDHPGVVTPVAPGRTYVFASAEDGSGVTAMQLVIVKQRVQGIVLLDAKIAKGDTPYQMVVDIKPANASNKTLKWTSSAPEVASVDDQGKITAISEGWTTITAEATDGGAAKAEAVVLVRYDVENLDYEDIDDVIYSGKAQEPGVDIKQGNYTLEKEKDYTLSYNNNTDAGTATITVTGVGDYAGTRELTFNILKADFDMGNVKWNYEGAFSYDGAEKTVALTGLPSGLTANYVNGTATNAGDYTASANFTYDTINYNEPVFDKLIWTINPREAALTWHSHEDRVYNGQPSEVTSTVANLVAGDDCTVTVIGGDATDAGNHTAEATGLSNTNYTLPATGFTQSYTITPMIVELGWTGYEERSYDGIASEVKAMVTNLVDGDACTITVTGGDAINAGTHTATAMSLDGLSKTNYILPTENLVQEYTIDARVVKLVWTGHAERAYDGNPSTVTATIENLVDGDACTITVTGGDATDAGTHTATAMSLDGLRKTNYILPTENFVQEYTIDPRIVKLGWIGHAERSYDGIASQVKATVTNLVDGDACAVTVTGGDATDADTYTATATGLSNTNYTLPATGFTQSYTIIPRVAELVWSGYEERSYDGIASQVKATVTNLVNGDACTVTVTGGDATDADTYTATATGLSNTNYTLPVTGLTQSYTITPRIVELGWIGHAERSYDGIASEVKATVTNLVDGDACTVTVTGGDATDAGTYIAKATGLSNINYALPATGLTQAYEITKADFDMSGVKWNYTKAFTYDGTDKTIALTGLPSGLTVASYTANTAKNTGTYTASAKFTYNTTNYNEPIFDDLTWTINTRAVVLNWQSHENRIYDGNASNVTATVANLVAGDDCIVTVVGGDAINVGTYTAIATGLAGLNKTNYALPETGLAQDYKITKATYNMNGVKWNYTAAFTYDKTSKTVALSGLPSGVTVKQYAGNTATAAGRYAASVTFIYDSANYIEPRVLPLSWVIAPKVVGLTWHNHEKLVYNGRPSAVSAEATGLVSGDSCTVEVTGGTAINAGTHTATAASLSNGNYKLPSVIKQNYTITKAPSTISEISDISKIYDGKPVLAPAYTRTGDGAVSITYYQGTAKLDSAPTNAGSYSVTVIAAEGSNHLTASASKTFTIDKAAGVASIISDISKTYDGKPVLAPAYTRTGDGAVAITYYQGTTKLNSAPTNAGSYKVTVTAAEGSNHLSATASKAFTIKKARYDMSQAAWTKDAVFWHDGQAKQVTISGLPQGVSVAAYTGNSATDPGSYVATAMLVYDQNNYEAPSLPACAWSIKPIPVQTITITPTEADITAGDKLQLEFLVEPEDAFQREVIWSSDNEAVLTVDEESGLVTALAYGTAEVTAIAKDGSGIHGVCKIQVLAAALPGDADADQMVEVSDLGHILEFMFGSGSLNSADNADAKKGGGITVEDLLKIIDIIIPD